MKSELALPLSLFFSAGIVSVPAEAATSPGSRVKVQPVTVTVTAPAMSRPRSRCAGGTVR